MAVDDITTVITVNMAQGNTTDYQPGSGIESMMLAMGDVDMGGSIPNRLPAMQLNLIDGTNNQTIYLQGNAGDMASAWFNMKMVADNTNYFRVAHQGVSTGDYGFAVIQVG